MIKLKPNPASSKLNQSADICAFRQTLQKKRYQPDRHCAFSKYTVVPQALDLILQHQLATL